MNLKLMTNRAEPLPASNQSPEAPNSERSLTLLVEGTAISMLVIDADLYAAFREKVSRLAIQMPDRLPEAEKLLYLRSILQEYESYRNSSEAVLRERLARWRGLSAKLFTELLANLGVDRSSACASPLLGKIGTLSAAAEIEAFGASLDAFLRPGGAETGVSKTSQLRIVDRSTVNDNAAGLRGGGAAVEHLARILTSGDGGFVVQLRLGCLAMVRDRFGIEAVHDCLMEVAAYLTHSLRHDDVIYHWSDSTLLAILQGRPSEQILTAELNKVAAQNRYITISVGDREVMLRIPLDFELTPVVCLQSPEDLFRLS